MKKEELQKPKSAIINSTELGTLGAYFEADTAQKKIKELKQQLLEKDKEIANIRHEICKQVCDEIMEELKENVDCYFEERKCNSPHSQLPYIWFNEIRFRKFLDKIERGEE